MIDETLFEAEEKMEKAVEVAKEDFAGDPDRAGQPGDVQQVAHRVLRSADSLAAAGVVHHSGGADHPDQAVRRQSMHGIEKAIRDSDLGVNPSNDGVVIRSSCRT